MNKVAYITISGLAMCLAGISILLLERMGLETTQLIVSGMFSTGGLLAYLFSAANKHYKLARQYYLLLGIGMIIFAILSFSGSNSVLEFQKSITYFMALFGLIEIIFGFMALNSSEKNSQESISISVLHRILQPDWCSVNTGRFSN